MNAGIGSNGPSMDEWALEPLDDAPASRAGPPTAAASAIHANTRGGKDRRVGGDRRQSLRFEADRRSGKDRRPNKGWDPGRNL